MKILKKIFGGALLVSSLFLTSCEEKLDVIPNDAILPDVAFQSVDDLQNALNATYSFVDTQSIRFNSIFSDNTKVGKDSGGQEVNLHSWVLTPNVGVAQTIWQNRYTIINRASRVIQAADIIDRTGREQEVNNILAQAYALRAFAHFGLYQYYTPDYSDPNGLSVPAVDFPVTVENLPRNTVSEVLAAIEADLVRSSGLIDASQTDNRFITEDFITALRARIALFSGEYATALTLANQLIADYPLADQAQYRAMFLDQDNTEVIFKAARVNGDGTIGGIWHFGSGNPFIEMSNSFFNLLDPADIRFSTNLNVAESDPAANVHLINKYPGTSQRFLADFKIFRVSEMHLIKAEAEARAGNFTASQETIKGLRDARFGADTPQPTYTTLNDALDFILDERRVELAFEGHRYLDLKRLSRTLNRANADCGGLSNACQLTSTDQRFTLPIPSVEINANPEMVQNPGY
ncbi:RagB/SusD family nutrient uptake outer membrane protein [Tenacibaculum jejuense]|uniref:Probable lipoprotein, SusD/RagB family n=1 Tax=Tenacibaculum jejuense TaxID=584609 RepID=A0A238UD44_9FLAO|nr:RagB/SusD family nutrient uptake outer membrane protein [Tenacibaculum jejuense]SNR17089.1 Probable lipoprotein precursor, SusD/RagB family [Tenacibaculum jejuense]